MMLYLFLGMTLTGCGLMILAVSLPLSLPHSETVHHLGLIAAWLGAVGLLFIWNAATS